MTGLVKNAVLLAATVMTAACGSEDCEVYPIAIEGYPTSGKVNMTLAFTGTVSANVCVDSVTMELTMPDATVMTLTPSILGCASGATATFSVGITPTMVGAHQFEIVGHYTVDGVCEDSTRASGSFAVTN